MGGKLRTTGITFRLDRDSIRTNSDDSITVSAHLTKTGVFEYMREDGKVRELRSDSEVFSDDSLATLDGRLITVDHPAEFLSATNWQDHAVGHVSHVAADPPYVSGKLTIYGDVAKHRIRNGHLTEVSCGYACIPQELEREDADIEQTHISYNHVAIGPPGWSRLGTQLRLDSDGQEILTPATALTNDEESMSDNSETLASIQDALKALQASQDSLKADFEAQEEVKVEDSPVTKFNDLPDFEKVDAMVREQVDSILKLELEARDAYGAFFPDDYIKPELCGLKLCEAVLHTVDSNRVIKEEDDLAPLVREAQLLAKKERLDALRAKPSVDSIKQQLTGVAARVLQTPTSVIDAACRNQEDN